MTSSTEIAEQYFVAWTSGDFETARTLLRDDVAFSGPIDRFDNADDLIDSLRAFVQIVTGAERCGLVGQGDEVCAIYDLSTDAVESSPVAEWYLIRDGRIASLEVFFDARPFVPRSEQRSA